jgi:hypothetical protein
MFYMLPVKELNFLIFDIFQLLILNISLYFNLLLVFKFNLKLSKHLQFYYFLYNNQLKVNQFFIINLLI